MHAKTLISMGAIAIEMVEAIREGIARTRRDVEPALGITIA
ncbi:hypothetical protein [Burkholderia guangdongensis]|nr:hypothetical protein [Burkholderia guangdongensis]